MKQGESVTVTANTFTGEPSDWMIAKPEKGLEATKLQGEWLACIRSKGLSV